LPGGAVSRRRAIAQVVVLLMPPPNERVIETTFVVGETQHHDWVIRFSRLVKRPSPIVLSNAGCNPHLKTSIGIGGTTGEPARRESPSRSFRLCQNPDWVKIYKTKET